MAQVIIALDVPTLDEAMGLVDSLGDETDFYKVGLELFAREGPSVVQALATRDKRIFLDLKLHDIPNTVARAVARARDLDVDFLTLHTTGGRLMMEAAVEGAGTDLTLLGVTVLTSLTASDVKDSWGREVDSIEDEVVRLARLAQESGVGGVVASVREAASIKEAVGSALVVVTPGIRLAGDDAHDQARVSTPAEAVAAGADYLVVGRSVTQALDPVEALRRVWRTGRWRRRGTCGMRVSVMVRGMLALGILCLVVGAGGPAACFGQGLEEAAARFAAQWAAGDISQLQSRFSLGGASIQWEARPLGALSPRRAGASIREYLENREAQSARVSRTGEVGGEPPRGFAEIRWESRLRGMSEMVTRTVFVAFVYEDGVWRVAELRVLPQARL